ncbi:unnamed protein product [Aphanomyces euteiches]|uniref:Cyclic nucleotide-binding domain-containing protein n=1 Tax=Aphanomyces euteiches TaxID=100861 RepID=A0A6G0X4X5_9STRA|nr:hypothetical protein Ae201684_008513 [Aphanomyces euteiches]KAH9143623.1 hypothetical protein AeRB84_012416 [Aphanomyces euteiches]
MRRRPKKAPAQEKPPENKRGSLVITLKRQSKHQIGGAAKGWNGLAILHAEHESTLDERRTLLIDNVPILSMAIANGVAKGDLMAALQPLVFQPNEFVLKQGEPGTRLYFVESGSVDISKATGTSSKSSDVLSTRDEFQYFGEGPFVMTGSDTLRTANVVAVGAVRCFCMDLNACHGLLKSVQALLRYRFVLREQGVLDNLNVFSALNPKQRSRMLDLTTLRNYATGESICKQGDIDDQYFVLVEGEVKVCIQKDGTELELVRKVPYEGFGEMGLFGKARTADVVAARPCKCIIVNRDNFVKAQNVVLDGDAEEMLATNLSNEWHLMRKIEQLHENPNVVAHIGRLIRRFKRSQAAKIMGKTLYTDLFRRVFHNPKLALEFSSISNKIDWFDATTATKAIRSEAKRLLSNRTVTHSSEELAFLGRFIDTSSLLDKFRISDNSNSPDDKYAMAQQLAKILSFVSIREGHAIFRQNSVEGKAYVVLSGIVHVVLEDFSGNAMANTPPNVIAMLTAGDSFGELSLVTNMARSASAVAATDVELILIERRDFSKFVASRPGFKIRHYIIERADFIEKLPAFRKYDHKGCIRIAYDMNQVSLSARQVVLQAGERAPSLFIIREGHVAVFKAKDDAIHAGVQVALLGPKECFGLSTLQLLHEVSTYMTTTAVVLLELPANKIRRLEAAIQDKLKAAMTERGEWEAQRAHEMAAKGTALWVKTTAPWCPVGDEKTSLNHHVEDRQRYHLGLPPSSDDDDDDGNASNQCEVVETRPQEPPRLRLPTLELPKPSLASLVGSFMTKTMQSFHMATTIVAPAPIKGPQLAPTVQDVKTPSTPNEIAPDDAATAAVDEENDEEEDDEAAIARIWQLDRTIRDNLYL